MRPSLLVLTPLLLVTSSAWADRTGGGGHGGGGRLGQVSGGLATATSSGSSSNGGRSAPQTRRSDGGSNYYSWYHEEWRDCPAAVPRDFGPNGPPSTSPAGQAWCRGRYVAVIDSEGTVVREYQPDQGPNPAGAASLDFFIGAQKVIDSDASVSLSLAVQDGWFRFAGAVTRYQEQQMDGSTLKLTLPSLLVGVRLDHGGATSAYVEAGVAVASTHNDPVADSSVTGAIGGFHLVHRLNAKGNRSLIGDVHAMAFESQVRAYDARVGLRIGYVEAALRVLDFNIGPALYGPELGLRF